MTDRRGEALQRAATLMRRQAKAERSGSLHPDALHRANELEVAATDLDIFAASASGDIVDGIDVPHAWPKEAIDGPRSEPEALVAWLATVRQLGPERTVEVMKKRLARLEELRPSASPDNTSENAALSTTGAGKEK